jgi:hypothetical protein
MPTVVASLDSLVHASWHCSLPNTNVRPGLLALYHLDICMYRTILMHANITLIRESQNQTPKCQLAPLR